jgi:TRAP-type C4-dicarboxylate transport system permease small subunit
MIKKSIFNLDLAIAYVALVGLIVVTILGVVMRYVVSAPLTWLEEIQMWLIVWLTLFGGSYVFRIGGHVAIEMIADMCPPPIRRLLEAVVAVIVLCVLGFLVWTGWLLVMVQYNADRTTDVLGIPYALIYAAIPVAGVLMMVNYIAAELRSFVGAEQSRKA